MTEFKAEALRGYEAELERTRQLELDKRKLDAARKRAAEMPSSLRFEQPRQPFEYGELRSRVWQAPFTHGLTDVWRRRCNEYWARIEQRFGLIVSEPRHAWADDIIHGPVVGTYAVVLVVLPGERFVIPAGERIAH